LRRYRILITDYYLHLSVVNFLIKMLTHEDACVNYEKYNVSIFFS